VHISVKIGAKSEASEEGEGEEADADVGHAAFRTERDEGSIVVILQVALIQAERAIRSKNNDNNRGAWAWDVLCPQAGSLASPSALS